MTPSKDMNKIRPRYIQWCLCKVEAAPWIVKSHGANVTSLYMKGNINNWQQ